MDSKTDRTIVNNKVIHEMLETEASYNQALALLETAFTLEILFHKNLLLKEIKPHVHALKNISDGLLANATEAVSSELEPSKRKALRIQRTQLLKAFFEEYKPFAELYNRFSHQFKTDPEQFGLMDKYLHKYSPIKLRLADHLIMPVQRGPRYSMLVAATKKLNEHLDDFNLNEFTELDALIADCLQESNGHMAAENAGYKFGDLTKSAVSKIGSYKFGDITRTLLWGSNPSLTAEQIQAVQISSPMQINEQSDEQSSPKGSTTFQ